MPCSRQQTRTHLHTHRCMHPLAHAWRCCAHASTHMHTHMHTHMQAHAHCRTRTRIRTLAIVGTLHQYVRIHSSGRMAGNRQWTSTPAGLSYRSSLSAFGTNCWSGKPARRVTGSKYSTVRPRRCPLDVKQRSALFTVNGLIFFTDHRGPAELERCYKCGGCGRSQIGDSQSQTT